MWLLSETPVSFFSGERLEGFCSIIICFFEGDDCCSLLNTDEFIFGLIVSSKLIFSMLPLCGKLKLLPECNPGLLGERKSAIFKVCFFLEKTVSRGLINVAETGVFREWPTYFFSNFDLSLFGVAFIDAMWEVDAGVCLLLATSSILFCLVASLAKGESETESMSGLLDWFKRADPLTVD